MKNITSDNDLAILALQRAIETHQEMIELIENNTLQAIFDTTRYKSIDDIYDLDLYSFRKLRSNVIDLISVPKKLKKIG